MTKNKKLMLVGKYLVAFVMLYICASANLEFGIAPFGKALAFAFIIAAGMPCYIIAPLYFSAAILTSLTTDNLIISGVTALIIFIVGLLYLGKTRNIWLSILLFVLVLAPATYFNIYYIGQLTETLIENILALISFVAFSHILKAVFSRPMLKLLTIDECVALGLIVVAFGCGIASQPITSFNLFKVVAIFTILTGVFALDKTSALILPVLLGLGYALHTLDVTPLALLCSCTVAALAFKNSYRVFSCVAVVAIDLAFSFYFGGITAFTYVNVVETLVGACIFLCIPGNFYEKTYGYLCQNVDKLGSRNLINRNRDILYRKLIDLSSVFAEMNIVFRQMLKGNLNIPDAKKMLVNETVSTICKNCENYNKCYRSSSSIQGIMNELMNIGFERGKTTLLDIPVQLTSNCKRVNQLLITMNQLITQYKQYANMISNLDASKTLIADQLCGVSQIMRELGNELNKKVTFNTTKENKLIEELAYNNIICSEAIIFEPDNNNITVTVLVRNADAINENLGKIVNTVCKSKLAISEMRPSEKTGWSLVSFGASPHYEVVFGYSGATKTGENISGDNYSLLRVDGSKFLMAVCDGMGSGEEANKTSKLAINLIENFYKAGFGNDIILSSVNKLLTLNNDETFTALDVCVLDLKSACVDFIKLGAPLGFIKHTDHIDIIKGGALPIGILEELKPSIQRTYLNDGDILILCSDGVVDAFNHIDTLQNFILNSTTLHPQTLADNILKYALSQNQGLARDDMTVLVARTFRKS